MLKPCRAAMLAIVIILTIGASSADEPARMPTRNIGGPGDFALREKLIHRLSMDPEVLEQEVRLILVNGGVVLSGTVANCSIRLRILSTAASTLGVINVTDYMQVEGTELGDEALRNAVQDVLSDQVEPLGLEDLEVSVADGVATLSGTASDFIARVRAEEAAGTVLGVRRIENRLRPADAPSGSSDKSITEAVVEYLSRTQQFPYPSEIDVRTEDGVVTLTGSVRLHIGRRQAPMMVSFVGGVKRVDSRLVVNPSLGIVRTRIRPEPAKP